MRYIGIISDLSEVRWNEEIKNGRAIRVTEAKRDLSGCVILFNSKDGEFLLYDGLWFHESWVECITEISEPPSEEDTRSYVAKYRGEWGLYVNSACVIINKQSKESIHEGFSEYVKLSDIVGISIKCWANNKTNWIGCVLPEGYSSSQCPSCCKRSNRVESFYFINELGKIVRSSDIGFKKNQPRLIKDCPIWSEILRSCDRCDDNYVHNTGKTYNGTSMCLECYNSMVKCPKCGKRFFEEEGYSGLCKACYSKEFYRCSHCGLAEKRHKNNKTPEFIKTSAEEFCCRACYSEYEGSLMNYKYSPAPIFYKEKFETNNKLFLGLEIEVDSQKNSRGIARVVNDIKFSNENPLWYVKSDSSINGIEIVTMPMSYEFIKKNISYFNTLFSTGRTHGFNNDEGACGFHIHMSKDAFTSSQMYKFIKFIYSNKSSMLKISGRSDFSRVSKYANLDVGADCAFDLARKKTNSHDERYRAINLSRDSTLEVRFFAAVLDSESMLSDIEFCVALFNFCSGENKFSTKLFDFKSYVDKFQNDYTNLKNLFKYKVAI